MPEGFIDDGGQVSGTVRDDPDREPDPTADAPRGWAWQRKDRAWAPRQRGPIKWKADIDAGSGSDVLSDGARVGSAGGGGGKATGDPDPSWLRDPAATEVASEKLKWSEIPAEAKDNAASLAGMLGMPLLAFAQAADPYCGSVLAANYENIIDHTLPLILRSQKAISFLTSEDSDWLLWFGLAQALWPLATAVYKHHIARTVEVLRDDGGQLHVVERVRDEGHGEHLTPQPQPAYAA